MPQPYAHAEFFVPQRLLRNPLGLGRPNDPTLRLSGVTVVLGYSHGCPDPHALRHTLYTLSASYRLHDGGRGVLRLVCENGDAVRHAAHWLPTVDRWSTELVEPPRGSWCRHWTWLRRADVPPEE